MLHGRRRQGIKQSSRVSIRRDGIPFPPDDKDRRCHLRRIVRETASPGVGRVGVAARRKANTGGRTRATPRGRGDGGSPEAGEGARGEKLRLTAWRPAPE